MGFPKLFTHVGRHRKGSVALTIGLLPASFALAWVSPSFGLTRGATNQVQCKGALVLHFLEMECWPVVIQWKNSAALPLHSWDGVCNRGGHCLSTWVVYTRARNQSYLGCFWNLLLPFNHVVKCHVRTSCAWTWAPKLGKFLIQLESKTKGKKIWLFKFAVIDYPLWLVWKCHNIWWSKNEFAQKVYHWEIHIKTNGSIAKSITKCVLK